MQAYAIISSSDQLPLVGTGGDTNRSKYGPEAHHGKALFPTNLCTQQVSSDKTK
jgi:hypothetical protein